MRMIEVGYIVRMHRREGCMAFTDGVGGNRWGGCIAFTDGVGGNRRGGYIAFTDGVGGMCHSNLRAVHMRKGLCIIVGGCIHARRRGCIRIATIRRYIV